MLATTTNLFAQKTTSSPIGHAPISVMGDHTHKAGDIMLSYRYMRMSMEGMRSGTSSLTSSEVLTNYMVTPTDMTMNMHMLGFMYGVSDRITLMGMLNFMDNTMDHQTPMGATFTTNSGGIGDSQLSALINLVNKKANLHLNLGLNIPTGSIDETDVTPASEPDATQLPYPMQVGTGTWGVLPGITYNQRANRLAWGAQASANVRLGENDRDYAFGNEFKVQSWIGLEILKWVSVSGRLSYLNQAEIDGADPAYMNLMMVPTVDPSNFGGDYFFTGIGLNFIIPSGVLINNRFAIEYEIPISQDLKGTQMERHSVLTLGWQYAF